MDERATTLRPLAGSTRSDNVARLLRTAILTGEIAPGERLLEAALSTRLGTSNGPVREALRQLEAEGLVVKSPYRGTVVAEVSEQEIEEVLIPVRTVIERFAFRQALTALGEADLEELRSILDRMKRAADDLDDDQLAEDDVAFHELIVRRAARNHCLQLWRVIQPRVRAYFHRDAPAHPDRHALVVLHGMLLDALISRDVDVLMEVVESHIRDRPVDARPKSAARASARSRG